jgi:hypothetical protein
MKNIKTLQLGKGEVQVLGPQVSLQETTQAIDFLGIGCLGPILCIEQVDGPSSYRFDGQELAVS